MEEHRLSKQHKVLLLFPHPLAQHLQHCLRHIRWHSSQRPGLLHVCCSSCCFPWQSIKHLLTSCLLPLLKQQPTVHITSQHFHFMLASSYRSPPQCTAAHARRPSSLKHPCCCCSLCHTIHSSRPQAHAAHGPRLHTGEQAVLCEWVHMRVCGGEGGAGYGSECDFAPAHGALFLVM